MVLIISPKTYAQQRQVNILIIFCIKWAQKGYNLFSSGGDKGTGDGEVVMREWRIKFFSMSDNIMLTL